MFVIVSLKDQNQGDYSFFAMFSVLGVKYPLFNLKGAFFLSQVILNLITNPLRNKKVCAPLEKMGI